MSCLAQSNHHHSFLTYLSCSRKKNTSSFHSELWPQDDFLLSLVLSRAFNHIIHFCIKASSTHSRKILVECLIFCQYWVTWTLGCDSRWGNGIWKEATKNCVLIIEIYNLIEKKIWKGNIYENNSNTAKRPLKWWFILCNMKGSMNFKKHLVLHKIS